MLELKKTKKVGDEADDADMDLDEEEEGGEESEEESAEEEDEESEGNY